MAEWTCPHGATHTGSEDFVSGVRSAHLEIEAWANAQMRSGRSLNDIAYDIVQAAPQVEALVDEWFAATSAARIRELALFESRNTPSTSTEGLMRDRIKGLRRVRADRLVAHPENWRRHPDRQRRILSDVLEEIGFADAVLVREVPGGKLQIIDGHLRADVAGETKIPVLVVDVDEQEARKLLLSLDPLAMLAETDRPALLALAAAAGPSSAGLEELIRTIAPGGYAAPEDDEVPPAPEKPHSKDGDLYALGEHRLLCGDARDPGAVARLIAAGGGLVSLLVTDPPYGVDYEGKTRRGLKIQGDARDAAGTKALVSTALTAARAHLAPGTVFYVCSPAGPEELLFRLALVEAGFAVHQAIVWVKDRAVLGRSDYHWRHESILAGEVAEEVQVPREHGTVLYGWTSGRHAWFGGRRQDTVWEIPRPRASREHPTIKPLELVLRALAFSSEAGDAVLDPFVGSGTTILAAEHLGRRCLAMEVDPRYVDVACARWAAVTGEKAVLERRAS